ncbi:polyphosphate polymerase domain-containing protein [Microbacterium gorillae]|uniref:polyphosphate polymerase domain-containing protein n=1 Tax=Microbacterium gorillae TaxID=1231063 RepID=UPI0005911AB1|nr:polyphosphate polymerase domain-containing protein [Microbacterium gorillae]
MNSLAHLEPITLDELILEAALLTRVDRKYVVPRSALPTLLAAVPEDTRVLEIDGSRAFGYASMYFDTPDLLSFRMAALGRRRRFKVRTRSYLDTGGNFLEIKTKGARGTTQKDRGEYDGDPSTLTRDALVDIADALAGVGVEPLVAHDLDATLASRYRRATLLSTDGARATIDVDLHWDDATGTTLALPDMAIIETKSGARAGVVDRLLWSFGVRPVSVSKYATGLAALRPELPRNRWARLLSGPFCSPRSSAPAEVASCAA